MSRGRRDEALGRLNTEVRGWQADQELFDAAVAEVAGLNRTQWRCLDILGTRGPLSAGQLGAAARLTTGAVTAVVDQLEAAGLVRRVRDMVDRRRVIIEPTDEVALRGAPVYGPLMADADRVLGRFDSDQLELIADFIHGQRELLTNHTARVAKMPAARASAPRHRG